MATPKKLIRNGKVTWLARWRDPDGRQRKKSFAKRSDAVRHLAAMEADKARGVYVNADDPTTVTAATWAWLARRSIRDSTRNRLARCIRCHIEAVPLGSRRLAGVRPSEAQAWAADRAEVLAPATMRKVVGVLRSVYADAVLDRLVAGNSVARLSLPPTSFKRVVPLTVIQVLALADAMAPRYRAMVLVQAGLGLRIGELLGLRLADVNFLHRVVRIEHQSDEDTRAIVDSQPTARAGRCRGLSGWATHWPRT